MNDKHSPSYCFVAFGKGSLFIVSPSFSSVLVSLLKIVCFLFSFLYESRKSLWRSCVCFFLLFAGRTGTKRLNCLTIFEAMALFRFTCSKHISFRASKWCTGLVSSAPLCRFYIRAAAAAAAATVSTVIRGWKKALKAIFSWNLEYHVHRKPDDVISVAIFCRRSLFTSFLWHWECVAQ